MRRDAIGARVLERCGRCRLDPRDHAPAPAAATVEPKRHTYVPAGERARFGKLTAGIARNPAEACGRVHCAVGEMRQKSIGIRLFCAKIKALLHTKE